MTGQREVVAALDWDADLAFLRFDARQPHVALIATGAAGTWGLDSSGPRRRRGCGR